MEAPSTPSEPLLPAVPTRPSDPVSQELSLIQLGKVLAASGFFQDTRSVAQAIVKVLAGRELGLGPVASMTGIYVIQNRVTLSVHTMAALLKRGGKYDYRVDALTNTGCRIVFSEKIGSERVELGKSEYTLEDAKRAGLLQKKGEVWAQYPKNMLYARAMSNGVRWYCPDVFMLPIQVPEEQATTEQSDEGAADADTQ